MNYNQVAMWTLYIIQLNILLYHQVQNGGGPKKVLVDIYCAGLYFFAKYTSIYSTPIFDFSNTKLTGLFFRWFYKRIHIG